MPEETRRILPDQNIPQAISAWLEETLPEWDIKHVNKNSSEKDPQVTRPVVKNSSSRRP